MKKAYLVLSDGTVYEGSAFGADASCTGELVFTTGVVGYTETLTDPCYAGQIVMQTFPLVGNYGINETDFEGKCSLRGYVVREYCDEPSNFRSQYALDKFLKDNGVPGICGVDTRAITRKVREQGVMNAMICAEVPAELGALAECTAEQPDLSRETAVFPAEGEQKYRAALLDYGARAYIFRELAKRSCEVTAFPADTPAEEILSGGFDGLLLSGGPGDPAENGARIAEIEKMLGKLPIFGIGLGHQMAAIAAGAKTAKMKYGHRGGNQPVRDCKAGCTYITSQNHGYEVISATVEKGEISFVNANDGGCEGIAYPALNAFTVQFDPEPQPGPRDASFLFDRFISMMGGESACR